MTPVRNWKRWMALSCSHGTHLCPSAETAVLKFKESYNPHELWHLGDYVDTEALRKGGSGGEAKNEDIASDFDAGMTFMRKLRPTKIFQGNHEARAYDLVHHKNEMVGHCAQALVNQFDDLGRELKAEIVGYNILSGWRKLGDVDFAHGYMYNEQAIRDHCEMRGCKTVIGHLHKVGESSGRIAGNSSGYCVGWLGKVDTAFYALRRRATYAWSQGFAYGEFCSDEATIHLVRKTENHGWRLPL